ncbi:MAG: GTP-binding protein [Lachnospiraceae bacterium]|nr:GTP-binding protein [Lachnospiraceae bacterium]
MKERIVPITLVTGFLESGKTTAISKILEQGFGNFAGTTLLIDAEEEGEEHYDPQLLRERGVVLVDADNPLLITESYLQTLENTYRPNQVMIEYNGLFRVSHLDSLKLPGGWEIVRQMTILDGSVFHIYLESANAQFEDMVKRTGLVLFNRCPRDRKKLKHFKQHVLAVNDTAQVIFEDEEGNIIPCI